jgi:endonuclease/exonuclease/phosphatase family metal-dependent hydrolase
VRVYCTHLTADLSKTAPYPGPYASWEAENKVQMGLLLDHAATFEGPVVMAGDFNCSLSDEEADVVGEHEASCQSVHDAGYQDPATETLAMCTYCTDNSLVGDDEEDVLLDHIFIRGWEGTGGRRIYDNVVAVSGVDEAVPLSDHYGFAVRVHPRRGVAQVPEEPAD